ncbi:MAG TPA: protein kinase [Polyangiaceae bacterium]|nr:protein kinase [Polyangiaceae bacterium]
MQIGALVAGKYRIVKELGAGGMGSVWQAVHTVTERDFAIKFLHASCASSQSLLARFFQEAKVSGKLRHPSVIEIFDVGTASELGGAPYLVMELLDGASLDILVRRIGALPPRMVLESIADSARALALAHDKGIVHRDLKPANIFLHRPGTGAIVPKVLDFGISKIASASGTSGGPEVSSGLTQTGAVLGSPLYMSPEQAASDKTIDGRSDIHALGVVLWECLVGSPPFSADTYNNLVVQIITGERPRMSETLPTVPGGVAAVVERAMARRREDRFQTATELADALDREVARLPASTSITARTAANELFSRLPASSLRPPPSDRAEAATVDASTTGGVSVPSVRQAADPSPAAFTMPAPQTGSEAERAMGKTAYAATQRALEPTLAATVAQQPALPPRPAPPTAGARTSSRASLYLGGIVGAVVVVGAVVFFGSRHTPAEHATPPVTASAAAITSEPPSTSTPPAPTDSVAAAPSGSAAAPSATAAPSPPRYTGRGAVAAPSPKPAPAVSSKPKDSVQTSGF